MNNVFAHYCIKKETENVLIIKEERISLFKKQRNGLLIIVYYQWKINVKCYEIKE